MLISMSLQNFALIDTLTLDFAAGFTVLTGETGAGKSILLDALSACLGERLDAKAVRFGQEKAELGACFDLTYLPHIQEWLLAHQLPQAERLTLRRVINTSGRGKLWINGQAASLSDARKLGQLIVQLHSQHSQQQLLNPQFARQWLDAAARLQEQAKDVRAAYYTWQALQKTELEARAQQADRQRQLAQLHEHIEDVIGLADLHYQQLEQEHDHLTHFETLMQEGGILLNTLADDEQALLPALQQCLRRSEAQAERAQTLATVSSHIASAQAELEEAAHLLRQFTSKQEFDPARLMWLDEQLGEFHRLARKYRVQPADLTQQLDLWQTQLQELEALDDPQQLAAQVQAAKQQYQHVAQSLDDARQAAAPGLTRQLAEHVRPLALPEAEFKVQFEPINGGSADGLSTLQLLFSANRGMPPQPMHRIASGGELSRIALVMQVMNAQFAAAPVLVFDEVDVGISGGTAEIVGRLLAKLGETVQVICITHQAQVAAQGHQHLQVEKHQAEQATSLIRALTEAERILELARMSGGLEINASTLAHAEHLRKQAQHAQAKSLKRKPQES